MGLTQVPVHVATDLTPAQVKAYRIADNQTATIADWDMDLLPIELSALQETGFDLGLLGFDAEELARLMGADGASGLTDPDDVPEPPKVPVTQPGDLWLLGDHRLKCGDSTHTEDVAALMQSQTARMMFTDPPWNVAIGLDSNPRHRQRPGLKNDNLSPEQFQQFLNGFVAPLKITSTATCTASWAPRNGPPWTQLSEPGASTGPRPLSGPRTSSSWAAASITGAMSRSGMDGATRERVPSSAAATWMTCGRSPVRSDRKSIRR